MTRKAAVIASVLIVHLAASTAGAGTHEAPLAARKTAQAAFTARPAAARDGNKVKITFTLSAPTDVEVAVLDAKGQVVRHLAAGLLGENAPAPFKKNSLSQEIVWDGKDDLGKPAVGGPEEPL